MVKASSKKIMYFGFRRWELIDYGWYKDLKVQVMTTNRTKIEAETEGLRKGQKIDRKVNGKKYKTFLNSLEDFKKSAKKVRKEYLGK